MPVDRTGDATSRGGRLRGSWRRRFRRARAARIARPIRASCSSASSGSRTVTSRR